MTHTDTLKKSRNDLTFADLRFHFGTGRAFIKSGSGRDAVYGYRNGVMTDVGDIEESEWAQLMMDLIKRSGEEGLQAQLRLWATQGAVSDGLLPGGWFCCGAYCWPAFHQRAAG